MEEKEKAQVPIWNQTDADLRPCSGSSHLRPVGSWLSVLQYRILKSHLKCVGPEAFNILDIFIFMNFCIHNETSWGLDPITRHIAFCCTCALHTSSAEVMLVSLKHPMRACVEFSTWFLVSTSKALGHRALQIWDSQIRNLELFAPTSQYCRKDYGTYRNKWHRSRSLWQAPGEDFWRNTALVGIARRKKAFAITMDSKGS